MVQTIKGTLFVIAAPSGAGKTSLVTAIVELIPSLHVSISHTTRAARPGEKNGEHYFFVSPDEFAVMESQNLFLEHAAVFGHAYGTSKAWVEAQLTQGHDVILEIDWQGAQQIKQLYPDAVSIFILPPSRTALETRLQARGQDNASVIEMRLNMAVQEMTHYDDFDYLIINDDFKQAMEDLRTIIAAKHLKTALQQVRYSDLVANLLAT